MRFVGVKTVEQQDLQAVHRVRSSLIRERTAKANQLRGLVYEYGLVAPREISALRRATPEWLEDAENGLTVRFRSLLASLYRDLKQLDERVRELDQEVAAITREHEPARRLMQINGIGPLIASALYALVGDARQYRNGRDLAVALGLTPRQHSSGGKEKLLGISKRGDTYLRTLLIHGARSAVRAFQGRPDQSSNPWLEKLLGRRNLNIAAVALANKNARIVWALLARNREYESGFSSAQTGTAV
jgi:transposase